MKIRGSCYVDGVDKKGFLTLPKRFDCGEWSYEQVKREKLVAIYKRWKAGVEPHFEVVVVRQCPAYQICENKIEAREGFPRDEDWGVAGWTYFTLRNALEKFIKIT